MTIYILHAIFGSDAPSYQHCNCCCCYEKQTPSAIIAAFPPLHTNSAFLNRVAPLMARAAPPILMVLPMLMITVMYPPKTYSNAGAGQPQRKPQPERDI